MQDRALAIVTALHPDQWGEAWLCMARVLRSFDPERGQLRNLFAVAWKRHRYDLWRKERGKCPVQSGGDWAAGEPERQSPDERASDIARAYKRATAMDIYLCELLARGLTYSQLARLEGWPIGTLKSRIWAARRRMAG